MVKVEEIGGLDFQFDDTDSNFNLPFSFLGLKFLVLRNMK